MPTATTETPPKSPPPTSATPSGSSTPQDMEVSKENVIALFQDCAALLSITVEASASMVHDTYRKTLSFVGWGEEFVERSKSKRSKEGGEAFKNLAVVVVGSSGPTGRSLCINFARSGYTVFALLPLPSHFSPPTSTAFTTLTLVWSRIQKRLKKKYPRHQGSIIPVMYDPIHPGDWSTFNEPPDLRGLYSHSTDTVRAYCHDNRLTLVAVVCAAQAPRKYPAVDYPIAHLPTPSSTPPRKVKFVEQDDDGHSIEPSTPPRPPLGPQQQLADDQLSTQPNSPDSPPSRLAIRPLSRDSLTMTHEYSLINLYHANVIEPLAVIRELGDLLAQAGGKGKGRGRVIFVNGQSGMGVSEVQLEGNVGMRKEGVMEGAMRVIGMSREEAAKVLREELVGINIDVCEVVVGPMMPKPGSQSYHLRHPSDESNESDAGRKTMIDDVFGNMVKVAVNERKDELEEESNDNPDDLVYARRLALISKIWAVDDALLYSAVERALEDRYPRYRHYAGISPFLETVGKVVPGSGIIKILGRWIVGKLLMIPKK